MSLQVGDILLMNCVGQLLDQTIINTSHYVCNTAGPSGPTDEQVLHLANVVGNGLGGNVFKDKLLAAVTPEYTLQQVTAQRIWPTRTYMQTYEVGAPGTMAPGVCTSANYAVSITRRSDSATRDGQGRWQLAGAPASRMNAGLWNLLYREGEVLDFANQLKTNVNGTTFPITWVPCLYTPGNLPSRYRIIVAVNVHDTIRTMHRRTLRVGI